VRGAIHRSFADNPQYDLVMAQSLDEARQRLARHKPIAVLLPMTKPALLWAGDLRSRFVAPVVFCFSYSVEMSLCTSAREQGLHHFVELPGDHPSSWARNSGRISSTLEHAIGAHKRRTRGFANSTQVMPAAPRDLAISRTDPDDTSGRQRRTTLVQEVSAEELAATQAKASVPAEASQKRKQRRKRKRKAS
tara:strand:- start:85319 stop:85894 length:576 start_codon:yes stop_codon:yes gene_type:complete